MENGIRINWGSPHHCNSSLLLVISHFDLDPTIILPRHVTSLHFHLLASLSTQSKTLNTTGEMPSGNVDRIWYFLCKLYVRKKYGPCNIYTLESICTKRISFMQSFLVIFYDHSHFFSSPTPSYHTQLLGHVFAKKKKTNQEKLLELIYVIVRWRLADVFELFVADVYPCYVLSDAKCIHLKWWHHIHPFIFIKNLMKTNEYVQKTRCKLTSHGY